MLRQGVQGITDLITVPGLINLDFADVRTIMRQAGSALMGIGVAGGENRAAEAAKAAISSPLLEASVEGATGILLNITGGPDLGLFEVNEAAEIVGSASDADANIIFGAVIDESLGDQIRVTVIATGFDRRSSERPVAVFASGEKQREGGFLPPPEAGGPGGHRRVQHAGIRPARDPVVPARGVGLPAQCARRADAHERSGSAARRACSRDVCKGTRSIRGGRV